MAIPANIIIMWSGAINDIPNGWFLCNGSNGTPDLRNRFVVGAGSTYSLDATGGSKDAVVISHTHTAAIGTSPNHTHTFTAGFNYGADGSVISSTGAFYGETVGSSGTDGGNSQHNHNNITSNNAGESGTNANLPPYYALAYIMYGGE